MFLVDDLGWMGSTVYGSRYYETPNIERLARQGMTFTDAYAASPVCSPSRAAILTGKYPARLGFTQALGSRMPLPPGAPRYAERAEIDRKTIPPESLRHLEPSEYTFVEALKQAGYRTAHIGKWHLGRVKRHWPDRHGFETVFHGAPDSGPPSFRSPYGFLAGSITNGPDGEYLTDRLTDEALAFIEANRDGPFLLHLWHFAVHRPWQHKPEVTRRFRGREDPRGRQTNPIMASIISTVDDSLGRVLDKLDELGLSDDTIVILLSDNGGAVTGRVGPKGLPPTDNAPLRGGKGSLYEGGVRVPMIVSWPAVVPAGSRSDEVVSGIDLYPTLLEVARGKEKMDEPIDGLSLMPVLTQKRRLTRQAIFNYYPHTSAVRPPGVSVRSGDWKLIRWFETSAIYPEELELYNLRDDIGETRNLAAEQPARAGALNALIDGFLADTGALVPIPNPDFEPQTAALRGWSPQQCTIEVEEGVLRIEGNGPSPHLINSLIQQVAGAGPVELRLRASAANGGVGRVQWWNRAGAVDDFRKQFVEFALPADGDWHEVEISLAAGGEIARLGVFLPATEGRVEIDWIRLRSENEPLKPELLWEFEEVG